MSEEDGAKLYDIYPHVSDVVGAKNVCVLVCIINCVVFFVVI